jgi:hypothetical protein
VVTRAATAPIWRDPIEFDQLEPRESCTRELAGRISRVEHSAPVFDGEAADRVARARNREAEAAARVERLTTMHTALDRDWREAELAATAASLLGGGALERSIASLYRLQVASLAEQVAAAEASLHMARNARVRLEVGQRLRALLGLLPLAFMALGFGACAGLSHGEASHTVSSELADLYAEVRAEGVAQGLPFDAPACDELPAEVFASGEAFASLCGKQASSPHDKCGDIVGSCAWSCLTTNEDGSPLIVIAAGWQADDASSVPGWTTGSLREVRALAIVQALEQCSDVAADSTTLAASTGIFVPEDAFTETPNWRPSCWRSAATPRPSDARGRIAPTHHWT